MPDTARAQGAIENDRVELGAYSATPRVDISGTAASSNSANQGTINERSGSRAFPTLLIYPPTSYPSAFALQMLHVAQNFPINSCRCGTSKKSCPYIQSTCENMRAPPTSLDGRVRPEGYMEESNTSKIRVVSSKHSQPFSYTLRHRIRPRLLCKCCTSRKIFR
jgi:hypothetical protein